MWILPHLPLCSITNIPSFSSSSCQFPVEFGRISIKSVFPCVNIPSKFAAFHKTAPVLLTPDFKKIRSYRFNPHSHRPASPIFPYPGRSKPQAIGRSPNRPAGGFQRPAAAAAALPRRRGCAPKPPRPPCPAKASSPLGPCAIPNRPPRTDKPPPAIPTASLFRPQQTAAVGRSPNRPAGGFQRPAAAAAALPRRRGCAPKPPPCVPQKPAKKHRPGPIRAPGRHPRQRRVSRSDFQPPAFRCGSRPASAGCSDSRSDCRFWHCSGNFYSRFSPPFQGIVCACRSPLIPKNREDLPPGKIPPAPSHSGK